MDGTPLPVAIHCDYIEAGFHDQNYDLPRLIEHLKADPRIIFSPGKRGGESAAVIHNIPSYNADGGRSQYVQFKYGPTAEEAIALRDKCESYGTKFPSTMRYRAMFDLDILGLRAAGIAKHADFYYSGDEE